MSEIFIKLKKKVKLLSACFMMKGGNNIKIPGSIAILKAREDGKSLFRVSIPRRQKI